LRDVASTIANHEGDLSFIVQLLGRDGSHDWGVVAHEGTREPNEQGRIYRRRRCIAVFYRSVGVIDTNAYDTRIFRKSGGQLERALRQICRTFEPDALGLVPGAGLNERKESGQPFL